MTSPNPDRLAYVALVAPAWATQRARSVGRLHTRARVFAGLAGIAMQWLSPAAFSCRPANSLQVRNFFDALIGTADELAEAIVRRSPSS